MTRSISVQDWLYRHRFVLPFIFGMKLLLPARPYSNGAQLAKPVIQFAARWEDPKAYVWVLKFPSDSPSSHPNIG